MLGRKIDPEDLTVDPEVLSDAVDSVFCSDVDDMNNLLIIVAQADLFALGRDGLVLFTEDQQALILKAQELVKENLA